MKKKTSKVEIPDEWAEAGRKLALVLRERGVTPSEWGRILFEEEGMRSGYQNARNWLRGRGFNPANRKKVVRILNSRGLGERLSPDYFGGTDDKSDGARLGVRNDALGTIMAARKLRQDTIEALLHLDKMVDGDPAYWETQVNLHEGFFSLRDPRPTPPRAPAPLPKRRARA